MNPVYNAFYNDFEVEYQAIKQIITDTISLANKVITLLEKRIRELHKWLKNHVFESIEDEIYFFKEVKPTLVSKLIYYKSVLKIESNTSGTKKLKIKFYQKTLYKIDQYFKNNKEFYQYYRSRASYKDQEYFLRNNENYISLEDCYLMNYDFRLCTSHDYKVAIIMSNDLLCNYLENQIEKLNKSCSVNYSPPIGQLNWTGSKVDLVELIYALHHQKLFNSGNTDIKEIAAFVGKMFNIEIDENIYRSYLDIKNRKSNRTKFLSGLAESLNEKMITESF